MSLSVAPEADLVLASASPRRHHLLTGAGLRVVVRPADVPERPGAGEGPLDYARRVATEKALAGLARRRSDDPPWVLAADTEVVLDGAVLGKPRGSADAAAMLGRLSGRRHDVVTAWALVRPGEAPRVESSVTGVWFRPLGEAEIEAYVATGEPLDKAGAYGIQGAAGLFVERLEGSWDAVVGLPLAQVCAALVEVGAVPPFPFGVRARHAVVWGRIAAAARAAGRDPAEVVLVGVGKGQPVSSLRAAWAAGVVNLGESYVQEWREKVVRIGPGPIWHFVGRLQRNKARFLGPHVSLVHSVDSAGTAEALGKAARAAGRRVGVLAQVNVAGEAAKGGVSPDALGELLAALDGVDGLEVLGLMTVPPDTGPAEARLHFARVRALRDAHARPGRLLPELSMGMSGDFEAAIAEGATLVRVGTDLFGPRIFREA